jgi:Na+/proline symporter/nitrogen-specific signal transduction histidine kinase
MIPATTIAPGVVVAASFLYLGALFAIAAWADRRAAAGRSVIGNAWVYALSMGVYCTAWTYFGSVGRAASTGLWFLPIYLGPTLAMVLAWVVLRKMIRIERRYRITSIADFIASRYGKSRLLAGLVTLIALVGVVPYVALQLKAIASGYEVLTGVQSSGGAWWSDSTLYIALLLAGFTIAFGTRHLDSTERHEGMVAAIAVESVVKLLAFLAVGAFVVWGIYAGPGDLFARASAVPEIARVMDAPALTFGYAQWFALMLLAAMSVILLPRQFQVMVVENVDERHVRRASWAFPAYLLAINVFVLPIAVGGLLLFGIGQANPETFVLTLPLSQGATWLALAAFVGGLSAATGMVIVEAIAVSTMVCNDLVLPLLLRRLHLGDRELTGVLLAIRRTVIVVLLLLGYVYFRVAGEAYALVSIGLISFAAVAQFAPALLGGMFWKGGTRNGALAGLAAGALLWAYTLMLPSIAKSGWMPDAFVREGLFGLAWTKPEQLFGLTGLDNLSHALLWSLLANAGLYVVVSLVRPPSAREAGQAHLFVDVFERAASERFFWRGKVDAPRLRQLVGRFLGADRAKAVFAQHAQRLGYARIDDAPADARLVEFAERQLAGAIGSASARVMVASVAEEEALDMRDVIDIVEEASALRRLNEQLESIDKLKDDFMSSVTHELRTPLTSIRALAELMRDDPEMPPAQRHEFLGIVVAETQRLSRLVNQVLDMAKIESGHAEWRSNDIDLRALLRQAVTATGELFREKGARIELHLPGGDVPTLRADEDRLTQVVINLLSNAAKFVPAGQGRVDVRLLHDAHGVTVEVHDNGPGVPPAQRELVFEKFRQGGEATHRPQGTGLGLPISRQIVEHFGGRLWIDARSQPSAAPGRSEASDAAPRGAASASERGGTGTCFVFFLPWQHREAPRDTRDAAATVEANQKVTAS